MLITVNIHKREHQFCCCNLDLSSFTSSSTRASISSFSLSSTSKADTLPPMATTLACTSATVTRFAFPGPLSGLWHPSFDLLAASDVVAVSPSVCAVAGGGGGGGSSHSSQGGATCTTGDNTIRTGSYERVQKNSWSPIVIGLNAWMMMTLQRQGELTRMSGEHKAGMHARPVDVHALSFLSGTFRLHRLTGAHLYTMCRRSHACRPTLLLEGQELQTARTTARWHAWGCPHLRLRTGR